jgi:tetratricopeptide (TPR) repeat protein
LSAGLHYVEYYHEEVTLEQMAFLGWRPSADDGPFSAIPESVYTAPHAAVVTRYEDTRGPLPHFEPVILDTIWPTERHEGQYTRCRFKAGNSPAPPAGSTCRWDFGDGLSATGPEVEHVYLALGTYPVTLSVESPQGTVTARWPLEVYEMQHITDEIKEGKLADYARMAQAYDRARLKTEPAKELIHLLAENGDLELALAAGRNFVKRFGDQPALVRRVRRLMADCILRQGKGDMDEAIANYQASITKDTPLAEKLDVYARLLWLVGIERDLPKKYQEVADQVQETVKGARFDEESLAAYRRAVIALGDVQLWHGKREEARPLYQRAEALSEQRIPPQVRAARLGSFPNSIREYLEAGDQKAALDVVNRWEEQFPTEKLSGQTFFWRGKLLALRDQHRESARYLARAIGLAVGAEFESEARWLLAQSLEKLGRTEEARKELAKLVASGIDDRFSRLAREKLMKSTEKPQARRER